MERIRHYWPLVWELARTDFKLRYSGSAFGYVWAILRPLLLFSILFFIFSHVFDRSVDNYSVHLLTGIIAWTYFSEGTKAGLNSFISKSRLITQVAVPKLAIILASSLHVSISFGINVLILIGFYIFQGVVPTLPAALYALGLAVAAYALIVGVCLAIASLNVLYRDLGQIWDVILRLGFYAAPIIYPIELIPSRWHWVFWFNPMSYVIHFQRQALLEDVYASAQQFGLLVSIVGIIFLVGWTVFQRLHHQVAEHL